MKFTGDITVEAPRDAVFAKVRDARFFASCVEGVHALNEIDPDRYTAVLETRVAYLKFKFNVAVEVVRAEPPREIEARIEGTPLGIAGRLTARSVTRLTQQEGGTRVSYEVDAALTGKWITQEWVHFIEGMPDTLKPEQLAALDAAYHFTGTPNGEIAQRWYPLAVRSGYTQANAAIASA